MIYLLNIPTRIVIGSTLGIVALGAVMGTIGKMATGQILWWYAIALVIGTIPGAQIGGRVSKRVNTKQLCRIMPSPGLDMVSGLTGVNQEVWKWNRI